MKAKHILECRDKSILIIEERNRKEIVIAVPHHAPLGVEELPCREHKESDENTGILGLYIAQLLNCHSIIACNYFVDSNKNITSDYFNRLLLWEPKILVEIHGHGGNKAISDIEISSGNLKRSKWSNEMVNRLKEKMKKSTPLRQYTICGAYDRVYFRASNSKTITSEKWVPFHIELPKSLRTKRSHYHPFCEFLAETVMEILEIYDEIDAQ